MKRTITILIAAMVITLSGCIGTKIYLGGNAKRDITEDQPVSRAIDPTSVPAGGTWGTVRGILNTNFANINGTLDSVEVKLVAHSDSITNYSADILLRLLKSDTASMLANYTRNGELNTALGAKVNVSDTAAMLANYALTSELGDAGIAIADVRDEIADSLDVLRPLYVAVADTAAMLDTYAKLTDISEGGISLGAVQDEIADSLNLLRPTIDTAYAARMRWSGTATGLTAATGRTSLGGTTVGQNLFTLANPGAISFLQINANNTGTALSAANFKTALSLAATDVSLGNVTNESKVTMFTSPIFTGTVPRLGSPVTDTLATLAYARSVGGGDLSALTARVDSAINVLKDTIKVSDALHFDPATDTLATKAYARSVGGGTATIDSLILNGGSLRLTGDDRLTFETNGNASYNLPAGGGNLMLQSAIQDEIKKVVMDSLLLRSEGIFVFGAGGGNPGDTASFTGSGFPVLGSFRTGQDTLRITEIVGQLWDARTTDTLAVQIMYADTLNQVSFTTVWASATGINAGGLRSTSFASAKIPPRKWVWARVASVVAGRKPTMINMELFGYRIKAY